MEIKKLLIMNVLFLAVGTMNAQLKVGENPTTITSNTNLEIEGANGSKTVVKTDGKVGIGTNQPNAILDVLSVSSGVLIPRVTTAQKNMMVVTNNQNGMLVFDTDFQQFYFYNAPLLQWVPIDTDTDNQNLSLAGNNLSIEEGNSVDLSPLKDDLGNHNATTRLWMNTQEIQGTNNNTKINGTEVGQAGHGSGWTGISNSSSVSTTGYALIQNQVGRTLLNAQNGQSIGFRIGNVDKMTLLSNGNVGIGITNPSSKLHVDNQMRVGNAGVGYTTLREGRAANAGYLEIRKANNTRLGYIGWHNSLMYYSSENGAHHYFGGGNVGIGVTASNNALHIRKGNDPLRLEQVREAPETTQTSKLVIDNNGVVKKETATSVSYVFARLSSSITRNNAAIDHVNYSRQVDNNNEFNASTGVFTAKTAGLYQISSNFEAKQLTGSQSTDGYLFQIACLKSTDGGSSYANAATSGYVKVPLNEHGGAATWVPNHSTTVLKLNAGDKIKVRSYTFGMEASVGLKGHLAIIKLY